VFTVFAGVALLVVAVHSGAGRWTGPLEGANPGTPGRLAPDCEREAAAGREQLAARLGAARRQGSVEGILCVAEALAAMGDGQGVRDVVRMAEQLAGADAEARADVRAFREHFAEWLGVPVADGTASATPGMVTPPGAERPALTTIHPTACARRPRHPHS
jgi:hypothetical protein